MTDPVSDQDAIRGTYDGYAATGRTRLWETTNRGYRRLVDERARELDRISYATFSEGGTDLLDVGCGDGSFIASVIRTHPAVRAVGLDLLPERVESARLRVPYAVFQTGSAETIGYEAASFDVVSSLTLFSSLPNPELEMSVAREIARVMRPGGWLIWYDLRIRNPMNPSVHGIDTQRLGELFPGWTQDLRSTTLLPPIARRLGPATPVAYPLLHAIPPLRSHLVGRLRRPTEVH